jgi:3-methyladenine DNA glycosylase/8-oxoguanine DNA glycosylase
MDRWDGTRFLRPLRLGREVTAISARSSGPGLLEVEFSTPPTPAAARAVETMFVDATAALAELEAADPVIGRLAAQLPGLYTVRSLDPLGALVASVTAQQVNLSFAASLRRALLSQLGQRIPIGGQFVLALDPAALAAASVEQLMALRFSRSKARCLKALGEALAAGVLDFDQLILLSDDQVVQRLCELPGIGPWTACQYLGRVLGRPILVADDLGVRKAVQWAYSLPLRPSSQEVRELTSHYGNAAFAAQQLLLYGLAQSGAAVPSEVPEGEDAGLVRQGQASSPSD